MSWYTNLYPDINDFPSREGYKDPTDMEREGSNISILLSEIWSNIAALVYITPSKNLAEDPIQYLTNRFNIYWQQYLDYSRKKYNWYRAAELWQDEIYHQDYIERYPEGGGWNDEVEQYNEDGTKLTKEEYLKQLAEERANWKPSISWNHFQYNNCPEDGIVDNKKYIADVRNKLLGLIVATPKDITPDKDEDGYPISPMDFINGELANIKEWLNDCLYELFFSELYKKYEETSTQG